MVESEQTRVLGKLARHKKRLVHIRDKNKLLLLTIRQQIKDIECDLQKKYSLKLELERKMSLDSELSFNPDERLLQMEYLELIDKEASIIDLISKQVQQVLSKEISNLFGLMSQIKLVEEKEINLRKDIKQKDEKHFQDIASEIFLSRHINQRGAL